VLVHGILLFLPSSSVITAAETLIEATEALSISASRTILVIANVQEVPQVVGKRRAQSCPSQFGLLDIAWESLSNYTTFTYSCDHFLVRTKFMKGAHVMSCHVMPVSERELRHGNA